MSECERTTELLQSIARILLYSTGFNSLLFPLVLSPYLAAREVFHEWQSHMFGLSNHEIAPLHNRKLNSVIISF